MQLQNNTILITGGASGIGLGLAEAFQKLNNTVLVSGRSPSKLEAAKSKGLHTFTADLSNEQSIKSLAAQATAKFPALNVVIHNAGIMANEKLTSRDNSPIATETILTNLLGPIYLTNALLPHLLKQKSAVIITVTSGLAFVPLIMAPTYSASKAAIHSYTQSLRYQLKDTHVRTGLMGERQASDPNAMPLDEYIAEVFTNLRENPNANEILVKRVHAQRFAGFNQQEYEAFFNKQNETILNARRKEWDAL
jgi:uncharacterized oxidoreductase